MTAGSGARAAGVSSAPPRNEDSEASPPPNKGGAATGLQAAGMRAITARAVAFYFRAPIKAFFRGRIDYLGYARAINPHVQAELGWSWRMTTPALLVHAVKAEGWRFIPNQVLPPLMANTFIGAVLYTAYLQTLSNMHDQSSHHIKRAYPPPDISTTLSAGFIAGSIQSLLAAPFDALQVRFRTADILEGKYKTMWHYAGHKLHSIGLRGIFAGFSLSLVKDSFGAAIFFSTFETIKSQAYYSFITKYYGSRTRDTLLEKAEHYTYTNDYSDDRRPVIKPHYAIEPAFLLLAGISASITSQLIQHPLTELQSVHYRRLEALDYQAHDENRPARIMQRYYHAYEETFRQCRKLAKIAGGWRQYLYRDFFMATIRQVPSTSAGLIVFELVRRKYALESEEVTIQREGFEILLT
ncbi:mitochondrial carrier domain-containing protein [Clohesyomyces aquaticus]|uniref:Mitochondrial carrier domain-containing protein n=1 Tax=Clohesyomyces aquaticus TaxID=1231657 RepID=A0A1Y1YJW2_9PLEO|nr:mitochondrial carrier domain-containing protein [Clohesyomyces aquaticus]